MIAIINKAAILLKKKGFAMKQKIGALLAGVLIMSSISLAGTAPAEAASFGVANGGRACVFSAVANGNTVTATNGSPACDRVQAGLTYLQSNGTRSSITGPRAFSISSVTAQTTMVVDRWGTGWLDSVYTEGHF